MSTDVILVDEPAPLVRRITMNRPEKRNSLIHPLRGAILDTLRAHDQDPDVSVTIIRGAGPSFSAGYDLGGGNEGHEMPYYTPGGEGRVAAPRHRRLDEHLGSRQAGDRAGARLLPRGRRASSRPGCDLVYMAEDAQMGYPAVRFGVPDMHFHPWFLGHAQGDGDDAHRRLDLRRRGRRARVGERRVPGRRARRARARGRAAHRDGPARAAAAQQARRAPPDGRAWACAPASAPAPSCARSGTHTKAMRQFIGEHRAKGLTGALQERDAPFGDYRTPGHEE